MECVSIVEKRDYTKSKCRKWKKRLEEMRTESANIHQEWYGNNVAWRRSADIWRNIRISGLQKWRWEQDHVFFMNQTINE